MMVLRTIIAAFSMFSRVPVPQILWTRDNLRYVLCAFPLVGALIGLLCWGWSALCTLLSIPDLLRAAVFCLIPVLVTGGIHLDGYCDTWDALSSRRSLEKKLEILSDPHIGAFAVIHLCLYFLLAFSLWSALSVYPAVQLGISFCLSRSLSALAVTIFPLAKDSGLVHTFAQAADRKRAAVILSILSGALILVMIVVHPGCGGWTGVLMAVAALLAFLFYRRMAVKQFGGITGDLAGWFLQTAELWMLAAACAAAVAGGAI